MSPYGFPEGMVEKNSQRIRKISSSLDFVLPKSEERSPVKNSIQ